MCESAKWYRLGAYIEYIKSGIESVLGVPRRNEFFDIKLQELLEEVEEFEFNVMTCEHNVEESLLKCKLFEKLFRNMLVWLETQEKKE